MSEIQAITGMKDLLPAQTPLWQYLERTIATTLASYGYQEIRFPLLERTALFKRSIGEVTDIVEKEMYTFTDIDGESVSMRPEGTASCVRACIENRLIARATPDIHRLWYCGPMFRREKPQMGRQRQFHQTGVEAFGMAGPDIDAELILLTARLWRQLGILDAVTLELNSIGSAAARADYKQALVTYLSQHLAALDEDSRRRLSTNPLRILDSKDAGTRRVLENAPSLMDYLDEESREHFARLRALLDAAGLRYTINPSLVRGLDYYGKTVFEWTTDKLGAQGTVCAGGRYDGLVEQLGGKPTPAVGFAMGMERLCLMLEACDAIPADIDGAPQVYVVAAGTAAETAALLLAENLRGQLPGLRLLLNCGGGSFKSQFKKADKSGAQLALILGDDEVQRGVVGVKSLRADVRGDDQNETVARDALVNFLSAALQLPASK